MPFPPTRTSLLLFADGHDNASVEFSEAETSKRLSRVAAPKRWQLLVASTAGVNQLARMLPRRATADIIQVPQHSLGFGAAVARIGDTLGLPDLPARALEGQPSRWDIAMPNRIDDNSTAVLHQSRSITILPVMSDTSDTSSDYDAADFAT